VTEGDCITSQEEERQLWHWPETNGEGTLENLAFASYALQKGTAMNLTRNSGDAALWTEPAS
jgi:hypothetical protein